VRRAGWLGIEPAPIVSTASIPGKLNEVMSPMFKHLNSTHLILLAAIAGFAPATRADAGALVATLPGAMGGSDGSLAVVLDPEALQVQAAATAPRFFYGSGAQGFGYYAAPAPRATTATAPRAAAPSPVGPGARNWSTGRRSPLHRPWMRPM
jgi:hypothetical protein